MTQGGGQGRDQAWRSLGLVYSPKGDLWWRQNYAILPTPQLFGPERARIFFASTDERNFGRITYLDLALEDRPQIISLNNDFILDVGRDGAFDDCGVNPSCVVSDGEDTFLFYVGYERCFKTPMKLFAGMARLDPMSGKAERLGNIPVLERNNEEISIRTAPCVVRRDAGFLLYYVTCDRWLQLPDRLIPEYSIRMVRSSGLRDWTAPSTLCFVPDPTKSEVGFGRPWVLYDEVRKVYSMWYSVRRVIDGKLTYSNFGYAESPDGSTWQRLDSLLRFQASGEAWDSEMNCYCSVIESGSRRWMFYNGNGNGRAGFGVAVNEQ